MSSEEKDLENLDARRKRARFRAWHRGTREMDLILGPYADTALLTMDPDRLSEFEQLLEISDTDLQKWLTGSAPVPAEIDGPLFRSICAKSGIALA